MTHDSWTANGNPSESAAFGLPEWTLLSSDASPSNVSAKFSPDHRIMACRGIAFDTVAKVMPAALFSNQEIESAMNNL